MCLFLCQLAESVCNTTFFYVGCKVYTDKCKTLFQCVKRINLTVKIYNTFDNICIIFVCIIIISVVVILVKVFGKFLCLFLCQLAESVCNTTFFYVGCKVYTDKCKTLFQCVKRINLTVKIYNTFDNICIIFVCIIIISVVVILVRHI